MKEVLQPRPIELTYLSTSSTLDRGVIFVPEGANVEGSVHPQSGLKSSPNRETRRDSVEQNKKQSQNSFREKLRTEWYGKLTSEELRNPDTRSTIETAIRLGVGPETVTSKGQTQVKAKEVIENVALQDSQRLIKAAEALKKLLPPGQEITLTPEQKTAILKAHSIGRGEEGRTGGGAGAYNYSQEQLLQKAKILEEAGFNKEERRALLEGGIAASAPSGSFTHYDVSSYDGTPLEAYAHQLKSLGEAGAASEIVIDELERRVINEVGPNPDATRFIGDLEKFNAEAIKQNRPSSLVFENPRDTELFQRVMGEKREKIAAHMRDPSIELKVENEERAIKLLKDKLNDPDIPPIDRARFPDDLLEAAGLFDETREMLLSRIIFKPYDDRTERGDYQIDLYAQDNLKGLLESARRVDPRRYEEILGLKTAAELFHQMNGLILGGTLQNFIRASERIDTQHFEIMNNIKGVGVVMRLFEQKYQEQLASKTWVDDYQGIKKDVAAAFRQLNDSRLINSQFDQFGPKKLDEWEIERALAVGRTFFNLSFRAAEKIANGKVPEGADKFASFPFESAVRLLNWVEWITFRFEVGKKRGGVDWFYDRLKQRFQENNYEMGKKLDKNRITRFGGMDVGKMEVGEFFGISGIYSGWRMEKMAFDTLHVSHSEHPPSLTQWFEADSGVPDPEHPGKNFTLGELIGEKNKHVTHKLERGDRNIEVEQDEILRILRPLIDEANVGLGVLLKHSSFSGAGGYKAREALWRKVAKKNVPLMANYLTNLEWKNGNENILDMRGIQEHAGGFDHWNKKVRVEPNGEIVEDNMHGTTTRFEIFRNKLSMRLDRRVRIDSATGENELAAAQALPEVQLDAAESELEREIIANGKRLAPHLADILFPYLPFMNDLPFEKLDYNAPGQEFYKRRVSNDFGGFASSEEALGNIMTHPGGFEPDKLVEQIKAFEAGISSPNGPPDSMPRTKPVVETVLDMYMTDPGKRQALFKSVLQELQVPNSVAQRFAGMDAASWDEHHARRLLEELHKVGAIDHHLMIEIRNKKNINFRGVLWALVRDLFWLPFYVGGSNFVNETMEGQGIERGRGGH